MCFLHSIWWHWQRWLPNQHKNKESNEIFINSFRMVLMTYVTRSAVCHWVPDESPPFSPLPPTLQLPQITNWIHNRLAMIHMIDFCTQGDHNQWLTLDLIRLEVAWTRCCCTCRNDSISDSVEVISTQCCIFWVYFIKNRYHWSISDVMHSWLFLALAKGKTVSKRSLASCQLSHLSPPCSPVTAHNQGFH
jgi:hypothetical protein